VSPCADLRGSAATSRVLAIDRRDQLHLAGNFRDQSPPSDAQPLTFTPSRGPSTRIAADAAATSRPLRPEPTARSPCASLELTNWPPLAPAFASRRHIIVTPLRCAPPRWPQLDALVVKGFPPLDPAGFNFYSRSDLDQPLPHVARQPKDTARMCR
jgi:hypothetical protein